MQDQSFEEFVWDDGNFGTDDFDLLGTRKCGHSTNLFQCWFCNFWYCLTDADPRYKPPKPGLKMCVGCATTMLRERFLVGYDQPFYPRKN